MGTTTFSGPVASTAGFVSGGPVTSTAGFVSGGYTLLTLPTVTAGRIIFVSNANAGVGTIAFGNVGATAYIDIKTGLAVA